MDGWTDRWMDRCIGTQVDSHICVNVQRFGITKVKLFTRVCYRFLLQIYICRIIYVERERDVDLCTSSMHVYIYIYIQIFRYIYIYIYIYICSSWRHIHQIEYVCLTYSHFCEDFCNLFCSIQEDYTCVSMGLKTTQPWPFLGPLNAAPQTGQKWTDRCGGTSPWFKTIRHWWPWCG